MKFGIVGNITKPIIKDVIPELFDWSHRRGIDLIIEEKLFDYLELSTSPIATCRIDKLGNSCDVVLAFGGDGTILYTARAVGPSNVPILGINLGSLGFLAEVTLPRLYESIEDILNHDYCILERLVLKAKVTGRNNESLFYGLNDIVIDRGSLSRVMKVKVNINDEYFTTYLCDGVIVATPTGSTAHSLSAQGPILAPDVDGIIINPICSHSLGTRPMVIAGNNEIEIIPIIAEQQAVLTADGQVVDHLKSNEHIIIKKADYKARTIQCQGNNFFNLLRTKLNWGVDKRMD